MGHAAPPPVATRRLAPNMSGPATRIRIPRSTKVKMNEILDLPPRLDFEGARALHESLTAMRGRAVALRADKVRFVGGLGVQILIAAQRQWRADNLPFGLLCCSMGFCDGLTGLGFDIDDFQKVTQE